MGTGNSVESLSGLSPSLARSDSLGVSLSGDSFMYNQSRSSTGALVTGLTEKLNQKRIRSSMDFNMVSGLPDKLWYQTGYAGVWGLAVTESTFIPWSLGKGKDRLCVGATASTINPRILITYMAIWHVCSFPADKPHGRSADHQPAGRRRLCQGAQKLAWQIFMRVCLIALRHGPVSSVLDHCCCHRLTLSVLACLWICNCLLPRFISQSQPVARSDRFWLLGLWVMWAMKAIPCLCLMM